VALLLEVCVKIIVKMMVLLFWITYNRFSGYLMLLLEIHLQVMAKKPLMVFLKVSMLLNKYRSTVVLQYILVTWTCSQ
jgi:hypothetical protein